jgi:hypothetical protein
VNETNNSKKNKRKKTECMTTGSYYKRKNVDAQHCLACLNDNNNKNNENKREQTNKYKKYMYRKKILYVYGMISIIGLRFFESFRWNQVLK